MKKKTGLSLAVALWLVGASVSTTEAAIVGNSYFLSDTVEAPAATISMPVNGKNVSAATESTETTTDRGVLLPSSEVSEKAGHSSAAGKEQEEAMAVLVKVDGRWGLTTPTGQTVVDPVYKTVTRSTKGNLVFSQKGKDAITVDMNAINHNVPTEVSTTATDKEYEPFKDTSSKRWGFKAADGTVVIPPSYKNIYTWFSEGIAFVKNSKGKKVAIDETGKELFTVDGDYIFPYENGVAEIRRETHGFSLLGLAAGVVLDRVFNGNNSHVHVYGYDDGVVYNGVVLTRDTIKRGYIDKKGRWITDKHWKYVYPMMPFGTIVIDDDNRLATIDRAGHILMPFGDYEAKEIIFERPYIVLKDRLTEKRGVKNYLNGEEIIPFLYDDIHLWDEDRFVLKTAQEQRVYTLLPYRHEVFRLSREAKIGPYRNGMAWVYEDTQLNNSTAPYKLVDKEGHVIFELTDSKISDVGSFFTSYAAVKKDGKWGLINTKGEWIMAPAYDDLYMVDSVNHGLSVER